MWILQSRGMTVALPDIPGLALHYLAWVVAEGTLRCLLTWDQRCLLSGGN